MIIRFLSIIFLTTLVTKANGQLYINEFMASNGATVVDPEFADNSDWIEIYNAGSDKVNLKGYFITDNLNRPDKWEITDDLLLEAGEYHIIWADGRATGNHASFKLSVEGEQIGIYDPGLKVVDSLTFPHQKSDVSMGRDPSELSAWLYFDKPTPGSPNGSNGKSDFVKEFPDFSVAGKLFESPIEVALSSYSNDEIRFTTDGSTPVELSTIYTSPILIDTTTILRARIFRTGQIAGPVVTHSYFLSDEFKNRKLPILSLVSDSENFWDEETGIYAQDFKPDWEIPINIELFENDGSDRAGFNEAAGAKINGLNSWQLPQKMLGIYFRGRYGSGSLEYPLFFDRDRRSFDSFALRASGSDWSYTLFRDILGQGLTRETMDVETQGERPCIVYINGRYMGIHNMRSKVDEDFIAGNFNLEPGTFDMVENEDFAEAGSLAEYMKLEALLDEDLSIQANYDAVAEAMDIQNFTDYVIAEMYVRNTSIGHNVMAWKPHNEGKWRWILMDLDRGFFSPDKNLIDYFIGRSVLPLADLLENDDYREYFVQRLASHMATTFHPDRVRNYIDFYAGRIRHEMPFHISRWLGAASVYGDAMLSMDYWEREVEDLKVFADERPSRLLADLMDYGAEGLLNFAIDKSQNGGEISLNGFELVDGSMSGQYLQNSDLVVDVMAKPGFEFLRWELLSNITLIDQGSQWKYLDDGSDQGAAWLANDFDDASWASGLAQFGYGDGDEATEISYAGEASAKSITTYFRKAFTLTESAIDGIGYVMNVLYDDGVVIYLNGIEVIRANMPSGPVSFQTLANAAVGGAAEDTFTTFSIDKTLLQEGENHIAVELHQASASSSDISFDLELKAFIESDNPATIDDNPYSTSMTSDVGLKAVFAATDACVLGGNVGHDTTLGLDCSPYYLVEDLMVSEGVSLSIDPGVEIVGSKGASIIVNGQLKAIGTAVDPILFKSDDTNENNEWGALIFENALDTSELRHVEIKGASTGKNTINHPAAVSCFRASLVLDHVTINDVRNNPVFGRYSNITLTNSQLHSRVTGDLINVKYGQAYIANCEFIGNDQPDTDVIDLDDVDNGVVRNCKISDFFGTNSDAVDIGEQATNILLDSLIIYNITDKGVSVGQRSSVKITNSLIMNCDLGLGLKDSCQVEVNKCTFYGNNYSIACYEKNLGKKGGNVKVTNSILSNSGEGTLLVDEYSTFHSDYSLADNDELGGNGVNLLQNPQFRNPVHFDFRLQETSPARMAGLMDNAPVDLGIYYDNLNFTPEPMIAGIFPDLANDGTPEYIMIINPSDQPLDISGYAITRGVTLALPANVSIAQNDTIYLTNNAAHYFWSDVDHQIFQWSDGKLSNNGEAIALRNRNGILVDHVVYDTRTWPAEHHAENYGWMLQSANVDNHFSENWHPFQIKLQPLDLQSAEDAFHIYPNPSDGIFQVSLPPSDVKILNVISLTGKVLMSIELNGSEPMQLDLSALKPGVCLLEVGSKVKRLVVR